VLLYYITDRSAFPGDETTRRRHLLDKIAEAASQHVDYIQLREKNLQARDLEQLANEAMQIVKELRTALLLNSRTDIALSTGAHGVHLPANDISPKEVRTVWEKACGSARLARELSPKDPMISVSCHSPKEVQQAEKNQATLALFAPVFEKKDASPAGLEALRQACQAKIPVLALGGVTLQNAHSCIEAGAAGIAAIRLFQENDIATIVRELRSI
jgi:thiamine-phosphate pyrophosphorylase